MESYGKEWEYVSGKHIKSDWESLCQHIFRSRGRNCVPHYNESWDICFCTQTSHACSKYTTCSERLDAQDIILWESISETREVRRFCVKSTIHIVDSVCYKAVMVTCSAEHWPCAQPATNCKSTVLELSGRLGPKERLHIPATQRASQLCLQLSLEASWLALPYEITIAFNLLVVFDHLKHKCQPFVLWLFFLEWVCVCECVCVWLDNHSDDRQYPGCVLPIAKKGKKSSADHHCDYPGAHTYIHTHAHWHKIYTQLHTH